MREAWKRNAQYRHPRHVVVTCVDPDLIETEFAVPAQVRIDHRDRRIHSGAAGRNEHFVGATVSCRIGLNAAALQITAGFAKRPSPDYVTAERDYIPGMDLLGPRRHLVRMLSHKLSDAVLISFDACSHLWAYLLVFLSAYLGVAPHSLDQITTIGVRNEHLRHRPVRAAIVLQQLFEAVLGLGVSDAE